MSVKTLFIENEERTDKRMAEREKEQIPVSKTKHKNNNLGIRTRREVDERLGCGVKG